MYILLVKEFQSEKNVKEVAKKIGLEYVHHQTITTSDRKYGIEEEPEEILIKSIAPQLGEKPASKQDDPKKETAKEPTTTASVETDINKTTPPALKPEQESSFIDSAPEPETDKTSLKILGTIDLDALNTKTKPARKTKAQKEKERQEKSGKKVAAPLSDTKELTPKVTTVAHPDEKPGKEQPTDEEATLLVKPPVEEAIDPKFLKRKKIILEGPTIVGTIDLDSMKKPEVKKPAASSADTRLTSERKKKRKRIKKQAEAPVKQASGDRFRSKPTDQRGRTTLQKVEPTEEEIQRQIRETMQRLSPSGKTKASKYRREKRQMVSQIKQEEIEKAESEKKILKVTEFVTANELGSMMNISVNEIIKACFSLGLVVSINQRLDAETLVLVSEEFGYSVDFVSVDVQEALQDSELDSPEDLVERHPVVTVMGHVDHGKTSLLDYVRHTNVIAGEAGGITQHIGSYEVTLENKKKITFLDTPGHEAFTAMRARGTKITDIAIIVIAADDNVMPQTKEAINHAQAAGIPMVFAINKIDKPNANSEKVKEELSKLNILVEDWGGKYQSQEISAKKGTNVDLLLEKVLLEAELLELKCNPKKLAHGTVIESALDKGRGYAAKVLIQNGTLRIGDVVLAGTTYGRVKAMLNERNQPIKEAGPAQPLLMVGLTAAPQAGDQFNVLTDEREAKNIATKRQQLQREQGLRTQKHITLDEIGRRIALGDFKELNIIVKGDVDGSVEALSDSLLKLSTEKVQVNVIMKAVGPITESDVLLASASNAIIIGFQVRPSLQARKLAEAEQIDIRLYSIIYQAIDEITAAIEGMLAPEFEEKITSNLEVREVFKITKVGNIAGCMVLDGKITRNTKIRLIRDGIVVHTGKLGSLKRFKDDVKEVSTGQDCGLNVDNYNDIKTGDIIEGYEMVEIKKK
ncbi:MAG: translation initiation factor IF-2 [Bacteroidales bacterium]|nr:translation initiation factor IF-2 [Bacteroidales bacterium]